MRNRLWYQISILIHEKYQDFLVGQLTMLEFSGFVQDETNLYCYIPAQKWTIHRRSQFLSIVRNFKHEHPDVDLPVKRKVIREKNWNKTWEKQTGILEATPNIIIKPSWKKLPNRYRKKLILHIDPKMSFGTGHHETTRLSLSLLERFIVPQAKVLDFGCGTGILGIACMKLGAHSVVAIDNDEWAVENTRENIKRNHVLHKISVRRGSVSSIPRIKFDLVVANIDYPTIYKFITSLSARTRKHGIIVLSGILTSDLSKLLSVFKMNSLAPLELDNENEWTAIALRKT